MRLATNLLLFILVLTAAPLLMAACMFRSFLYYPTATSPEQLSRIARAYGWEVAQLTTEPGIEVVGLLRPPTEPGLPWALFFGGNAMDLGSSQWALQKVDGDRGFGLAVFAYRGYDGSGGEPTEKGLFHDAEAIADWLEKERGVASSELVLVGQSLGSGIAAHLAAVISRDGGAVRGLALLSPYTSIARVFDDHVPVLPIGWVIQDRYDTKALLDDLRGPVVIVHGNEDEIISVRHGRELADSLGDRARIELLETFGHNDLWESPKTAEAVRRLLE